MAKKVKFPLEMADGAQVRNIDELKEHFDIEKVVGYFTDGRLLNWLRARYYDDEADKVEQLAANDPQLHKKLCAIFGVESAEEVDPEEIARRQERLNRLKQYTDDRDIWERVDQVAFDQEDLGDLLDEDATLIYLCNNRFMIPLRVTDKTYVGIGKAVAVIRSNKPVDFDALNITFKKVRFDDDYQKILDTSFPAEVELPPEFETDSRDLAWRLETYKPGSKTIEKKKAADALVAVAEKLKKSIADCKAQGLNEQAGILEAHLIIVEDPATRNEIDEQIDISGSAPKAVLDAYESQAQVFESMEDEYFRGRAVDMRHVGKIVANQILCAPKTVETPPEKITPTPKVEPPKIIAAPIAEVNPAPPVTNSTTFSTVKEIMNQILYAPKTVETPPEKITPTPKVEPPKIIAAPIAEVNPAPPVTNSTTFSTVKKIIKEELQVDEDEIQMSSTFVDDLGADSLDIVELVMAFEEEYNIEIPDEKAEKIRTVGDVVRYIDNYS